MGIFPVSGYTNETCFYICLIENNIYELTESAAEESAAVAKSRRGETVALCIESPGVLNVRLEFGEQQVRTTETGINE